MSGVLFWSWGGGHSRIYLIFGTAKLRANEVRQRVEEQNQENVAGPRVNALILHDDDGDDDAGGGWTCMSYS